MPFDSKSAKDASLRAEELGRLGGRKPRHGHASNGTCTSTYRIWQHMLERCYREKDRGYARYGGRGIRVCESWHTFENFLSDMGVRPPKMSLERLDNDGDYCPENCVWETSKAQARNRRNNVELTHNGRTMCVSAWAEEAGISHQTIKHRLRMGLPMDECLKPAGSHVDKPGNTKLITYNGKTLSQTEWAKELGLSPSAVTMRLRRGAPIEEALRRKK